MLKRMPLAGMARRYALLLVIIAAAIVGGAVGASLGPALTGAQASPQIHACVSNYTGALRIVRHESQCTTSERPVSWNQQGQPGVADVHIVAAEVAVRTEDEAARAVANVACPAGYRVLGGGAGLTTTTGGEAWSMVRSEPVGTEVGQVGLEEWLGVFETSDGEPAVGVYKFTARAICGLTQ